MTLDITVTDLFCGAGGSSIGVEAAGARLRMAANHWSLAIETHNANFPDADHDCADVSQVNPRRYPRTDVLIASPECTYHSSARTNKPRATLWEPEDPGAERSRATMWDVVRFTEVHGYELVFVENVLEVLRWPPFDAWLVAMHSLGYRHRLVSLNSMVAHPTPQSRDRIYVVFWKIGNPEPDLDIRPLAWCPACERDVEAIQSWKNPNRPFGKYRAQYVYRCPACTTIALPYAWPAAAAIDWTLPAPRIGDRARPLAEATVRRIRAGLDRYGPAAIVQAAGHTFERPGYYRTWPTWAPLGTQTTTVQHGLVIDTAYSGRGDAGKVRATGFPAATQTGQQSQALVVTMRGTHDAAIAGSARDAREPVGPITTQGPHEALVVPAGGTWNDDARPVDEPLRTRTGNEHEALVVPLRTNGKAMPVEGAPVPTVVAGNAGHALLVRQYSGGAEMAKPVSAPAGTVTAIDHHALVQPFLTDYHGDGRPWQARPVAAPMGTVETVDRRALVEPSIEVDDCGFRMLEPAEIGLAMAFPSTYVVKGKKRDQVRQYGNAVTPPAMSLLFARGVASLAGGRKAS